MKKTKLLISNIANEDILTTSTVVPCSCGSKLQHLHIDTIQVGPELMPPIPMTYGTLYTWNDSNKSWSTESNVANDFSMFDVSPSEGDWYVRSGVSWAKSDATHDMYGLD